MVRLAGVGRELNKVPVCNARRVGPQTVREGTFAGTRGND
jgi:hypothetical protein